jgi:hypothetical protein
MRCLSLAGVLIWLLLVSSARAGIKPVTDAELDAFGGPAYTASQIEAVIIRNVYETKTLVGEIWKEAQELLQRNPLEVLPPPIREVVELVEECTKLATKYSIAQKIQQIDIARINVIKLEKLLHDKLIREDPKHGLDAYWRFIRSPMMREFHQLDVEKSAKASVGRFRACGVGSPLRSPQAAAGRCDHLRRQAGDMPMGTKGQRQLLCMYEQCVANDLGNAPSRIYTERCSNP